VKLTRAQRLLLWCAATDATFKPSRVGGTPALVGKCIHCGRKLAIDLEGKPISDASLEHILPRNHGGTDALANLAIACTSCNAQKGYRHDCQKLEDAKLQAVIETLQARRAKRMRAPPQSLELPSLPDQNERDCGH